MTKALAGFLALTLWIFMPGQATAHSFNVALVIPLSGQTETGGKAILDGFLLATKERDSHPGEESDGHLGGLDVYVHTADNQEAELARLRSILKQSPIDIIVSIGADHKAGATLAAIAGADTILLAPGRLPYPVPGQTGDTQRSPQLVAFANAFKREYGYEHSKLAARGYNAARRIDQAVRALGGVDDKAALKNSLKQTEDNFSW